MALVPKESKTKPKEVHEAEKAKPQKPGEKKSSEPQPKLKPLRDPVEAARERLAERARAVPPKGSKDGKDVPAKAPGSKKSPAATGPHAGTSLAGSKAGGSGSGTLIPAKLTVNTPRYSTPNGLPPGVAGPPAPRPAPLSQPQPVAATTSGMANPFPNIFPQPRFTPAGAGAGAATAGAGAAAEMGLLPLIGRGLGFLIKRSPVGMFLEMGGDSVQHPPSTGMPAHPQQPGSNVTTTPRNNYPGSFGVNYPTFPKAPSTGPASTGMPQTKLPDFGVQPIPLETLPETNILKSIDFPLVSPDGKRTAPSLPNSVVVKSGDIKIEHYYFGNDHGPAHLHVTGGGFETKIGPNGKPLEGYPELSPKQRRVVEDNISQIRKAGDQIGRFLDYLKYVKDNPKK